MRYLPGIHGEGEAHRRANSVVAYGALLAPNATEGIQDVQPPTVSVVFVRGTPTIVICYGHLETSPAFFDRVPSGQLFEDCRGGAMPSTEVSQCGGKKCDVAS